MLKIDVQDILFLKAEHVYVSIHLRDNQRVVQRASLGGLLEELPAADFLLVHRSYAVNLRRVEGWNGKELIFGDYRVPISRGKKAEVLARLKPFIT